MNTVTIKSGLVRLMSFVNDSMATRVITSAKLPCSMAADWEGQQIHLIDWRIADDRKTVKLEYQTRNDALAPILDCVLPVQVDTEKLTPPGRSKNWQWQRWSSCWLNTKTGERFSVLQ